MKNDKNKRLTLTTVVNAPTISELSSSSKLIHKEDFYLILYLDQKKKEGIK